MFSQSMIDSSGFQVQVNFLRENLNFLDFLDLPIIWSRKSNKTIGHAKGFRPEINQFWTWREHVDKVCRAMSLIICDYYIFYVEVWVGTAHLGHKSRSYGPNSKYCPSYHHWWVPDHIPMGLVFVEERVRWGGPGHCTCVKLLLTHWGWIEEGGQSMSVKGDLGIQKILREHRTARIERGGKQKGHNLETKSGKDTKVPFS